MMITRRHLLGATGAASLAAALGTLSGKGRAAADDFRALVVVYLNGGNDGNNTLVPTDGAYGDYQSARQNLALPKSSLLALPGTAAGHSFGLHPALAPLVNLYTQERLAFIANVGPLVEPSTAAQVLAGTVDVPPFLMSHNDQTAIVQGWTVQDDTSGWAGRALELLPSRLQNRLAAVTSDTNRTLVLGRRSPVSFMDGNGNNNWWGIGDLARPQEIGAQSLGRMAQWQFANAYEAEYARTYGLAFDDGTFIAQARAAVVEPSADFGNSDEGVVTSLRNLASLLPYFRSQGLKRQVFLQSWGRFDTHTNQRGSDRNTQDAQLAVLGKALAAFDETNRANGLDMNVVTLVMTEFGRTIRPGSGGGSEHAWGNHWFAVGGPVAGRSVVGRFPSLVLGSADDGDPGKNGRMVPTTSSDQVGATLMQWMGLQGSQFHDVFPNLVNFEQKTIPLLRT
ncbi:MAG: DUF1501 domain-containing protein [Rubrivivax sp.]|jgi:uncharacterized protein (DUF1501 family)|nr:DUF1501 domain-containing protein [Betaproteobacteria bacterium]MBP6462329.1 DUF1501 domain-containing protein [Rubrivivax sp.]MCU0767872.1 DUF1501 domain-containing protein [Burkholderiaceae bacterium]MBK7278114.1 DUF1501 domain-containing protein [Betaproteobacteria bacterium]MBK7456958.1 DUF1501 domain-containing protein [Betaproteobacteria bacterium]